MFSQEILTDRLAHLMRKYTIKKTSLADKNSPPEIADLRNKTLLKIIKALHKINHEPEIYGFCEDCAKQIPLARLEKVPEAPLCAACQTKVEQGG